MKIDQYHRTIFEMDQRTHAANLAYIEELHPDFVLDSVVGLEFNHQLFFLPYRLADRSRESAAAIAKAAVLAISGYRQKWATTIPNWVDGLRFKTEESLYLRINALLEKVNRFENELECWRDYKAVLTTSGTALMRRIIVILESFFEFTVRSREETPRAAYLFAAADDSKVVFFETKSREGAAEKRWIDDLSAHRNQAGFTASMPGSSL
jgi:hypothetical protein